MTRKYDKGEQPSGGKTTWTNTGATRHGRGQHSAGPATPKALLLMTVDLVNGKSDGASDDACCCVLNALQLLCQ